jgi:hypothetical protein
MSKERCGNARKCEFFSILLFVVGPRRLKVWANLGVCINPPKFAVLAIKAKTIKANTSTMTEGQFGPSLRRRRK